MPESTNTNTTPVNVTISYGPGNSIRKLIASTADIQTGWMEALGADPARVDFLLNGAPYHGALSEGDVVELKTRANEKGC